MKNETKLLNERVLQLAGICHPQVLGFTSNNPSLNENESEKAYDAGKRDFSNKTGNRGSDHWGPYDSDYQRGYNDAQKEGLNENDYEGEESACCGAPIINHDICSDCKEHTEPQQPYDEIYDDPMGNLGHAQPNPSMAQWKGLGENDLQEDQWAHYNGHALNEETHREQVGLTKHTTVHKAHSKNLISERMLGIVGLRPLGGVHTPFINSKIDIVNEVTSDLSRAELYQHLPMLHSNELMSLAEEFTKNPSGKSWGSVVEELTAEYFANASAKMRINETLKGAGLY